MPLLLITSNSQLHWKKVYLTGKIMLKRRSALIRGLLQHIRFEEALEEGALIARASCLQLPVS
jgi:hypothetical protein